MFGAREVLSRQNFLVIKHEAVNPHNDWGMDDVNLLLFWR